MHISVINETVRRIANAADGASVMVERIDTTYAVVMAWSHERGEYIVWNYSDVKGDINFFHGFYSTEEDAATKEFNRRARRKAR
jgi:hypothetical protein